MALVQIIFFLNEMETGKNGTGNNQERGRERTKEAD
jgi:hypothetical protein